MTAKPAHSMQEWIISLRLLCRDDAERTTKGHAFLVLCLRRTQIIKGFTPAR